MKILIAAGITVLALGFLALIGYPIYEISVLHQVKVISRVPDNVATNGFWDSHGDYTLVEDLKTHERFAVSGLIGQPGEEFAVHKE
jgi:hypothetical protein